MKARRWEDMKSSESHPPPDLLPCSKQWTLHSAAVTGIDQEPLTISRGRGSPSTSMRASIGRWEKAGVAANGVIQTSLSCSRSPSPASDWRGGCSMRADPAERAVAQILRALALGSAVPEAREQGVRRVAAAPLRRRVRTRANRGRARANAHAAWRRGGRLRRGRRSGARRRLAAVTQREAARQKLDDRVASGLLPELLARRGCHGDATRDTERPDATDAPDANWRQLT